MDTVMLRIVILIALLAFVLHSDAEAFSHGKAVSGGFLVDSMSVILEDDSGGRLLAQ